MRIYMMYYTMNTVISKENYLHFWMNLQRFYYFGIIEDLILRFAWILSMCLVETGYVENEVMISILSPLEVYRRFMWNYFRLENEHLNNCGKFRAVRDISVAPMDCSDQVRKMRTIREPDQIQ